jgi:hypothetical protein
VAGCRSVGLLSLSTRPEASWHIEIKFLGLRLRDHRPRRRCAANKRDELASFQLSELHVLPLTTVAIQFASQ